MGCSSSTAAAKPGERVAAGHIPAKGTPDAALPAADKVAGGDGSDTSTDDVSAGSSQQAMSGEISDPMESNEALDHHNKEAENIPEWDGPLIEHESAVPDEGREDDEVVLEEVPGAHFALLNPQTTPPHMKETALRILEHQLGMEVNSPSESEASSPRTPRRPTTEAGPKAVLQRKVSCLSGTSQREKGRRVSFNEAGPEVVHVEPLEVPLSSLRRSNAISADDLEPLEPLEHLEPMMWRMPYDHDPDPDDQDPVPWGDVDTTVAYDPQFSPEVHCGSRFGWCCVPRTDGTLVMQGELEYELGNKDGQHTALPYANQLNLLASQNQAHMSQAMAGTRNYL